MERIKLMVIKGTISKKNLTYAELKILGRSSEGLVHGISWKKKFNLNHII